MSTDDRDGRPGSADASAAGASHGASHDSGDHGGHAHGADVLRELMLGLAAQIDQVAGWISGAGRAAPAGAAAGDGSSAGSPGVDVAGDISVLLAEIGDLLARLIAALIAILEAVARALHSSPTAEAPPMAAYQPIRVRIGDDVATSAGSATPSASATHPAPDHRAQRSTTPPTPDPVHPPRRPTPEGEA